MATRTLIIRHVSIWNVTALGFLMTSVAVLVMDSLPYITRQLPLSPATLFIIEACLFSGVEGAIGFGLVAVLFNVCVSLIGGLRFEYSLEKLPQEKPAVPQPEHPIQEEKPHKNRNLDNWKVPGSALGPDKMMWLDRQHEKNEHDPSADPRLR